jgi:hypothetical protein
LDTTLIAGCLDKILKEYPSADAHLAIMIQLNQAEWGKTDISSSVLDYYQTLKAETELRGFVGMIEITPGGPVKVDYKILAGWLWDRARLSNSDSALVDLTRYLNAEEIDCETTLALSGVTIDAIYELGRGISLLPYALLRDCSEKQSVWERSIMSAPLHVPEAGLIRRVNMHRKRIGPEDLLSAFQEFSIKQNENDLSDALLCLTLIGPSSPMIVAGWTSYPEWFPKWGASMTLPAFDGLPSSLNCSQDACDEARRLFEAFIAIQGNAKKRLRIAIQRLHRAIRFRTGVDAAIDLGIALEALFLGDMPDDRGELKFRLRIKAARFLADTEEERKILFDLVGTLYDLRSRAVHTGSIDSEASGRPVQEVLNEGYSLTAKALRKLVLNNEPKWSSILLG